MLKEMQFKIVGVSPLLMHNGRLADPINPFTKALADVTSRRKKTDEDRKEARYLEWLGSIYTDSNGEPCLPADMVLSSFWYGAKKAKDGKEFLAGVFESRPTFSLQYDGPRDIEQLYSDDRFVDVRSVVVQRNRVMRTRPIFPEWSANVSLKVNTNVIDLEKVSKAAQAAGELIGMGDYRPRFGRFEVL